MNWTFAVEIIGKTTDQPVNEALGLHQAMMNEKPADDGHRQNILPANANFVGFDVLIDQRHG